MSSNFRKTFIAFPTVLIFKSFILISEKTPEILVSDKFINLVMGSITYPDAKFFVFALENLIYIFIFEMLFGHYIYNELRYSSTYVFSRVTNVRRWFAKKAFNLGLYASMYVFIYLVSMLILALYSTGNIPDASLIRVFAQLYLKLTLICFTGALVINVLSFYRGTMISFLTVYALQVLEVFLIMNISTIPFIKTYPEVINLLPINSLVMNSANYSEIKIMQTFYIMFVSLLTFFFSLYLVRKTDLSLIKHH